MSVVLDHRTPLLSHASHEEEDFTLYQPSPQKQILLHDMATSSSIMTFLRMKGYSTLIKKQPNSEFMSENGRLPVVFEKNNQNPLCGFTDVFWHVSRKTFHSPTLIELAYMDWVESKFLEAEFYICWCHEPVVTDYTQCRYKYDLSWPVSSILFHRKRNQMLNIVGKKFNNFDDFLEKFTKFLQQLNKKIGNRTYCLNDSSPSAIDALIYGHTKAILSTNLNPKLTDAIEKQRRIINLKDRINEEFPS